MKIHIATLTLFAMSAASAFAGDVRPATSSTATPAAAAFERLKSLVGQWEADSSIGKMQVTYELASGGHVLLEHVYAGQHDNMVTAYYLDGDKLALTHYCELGNEPRMVARRIDLGTGEIAFDFTGADNLASADAQHMHSATLRLGDANHFTAAWTLFENAKPKLTVTAQYTRVK